jgi:HEAT repeat protein
MGIISDNMVEERSGFLPHSAGIYRLIDKTMGDRKTKERLWAVAALGDSGDPRAVRALIVCCHDGDPEIRLQAIKALQKLRSGRAVDKRELPQNRVHAAAALAAIRSFSAIQALRDQCSEPGEDHALCSFIAGELNALRIQ